MKIFDNDRQMIKSFIGIAALTAVVLSPLFAAPEYSVFKSSDGIDISADLYIAHDLVAPFIVLFHQAGWSRGEYLEIAPKLNRLGFNCMAIDQRSGNSVKGIDNRTFREALRAGKATAFIDAYQDMETAIRHAKAEYAKGSLIVWGSSYSAGLSLKLAGEHPELVDGVLAFSPNENFSKFGKGEKFITEFAKKIACPVFITSARKESEKWRGIYEAIPVGKKRFFLPATGGNHGSRALWKQFDDSQAYWDEVGKFLKENFQK